MHQTRPALQTDERVAASLPHLCALEHQARGFSFLPKQPARSVLAGRHNSRLRGRGLSFEELRHYRAGDDIRSLDWKVTHRTGKPHVRVYTEERERQVHLLVDQRVSMFFGSQRAMKSVTAAEVAALAAWRVLSAGDRLSATIFDDERCYSFAPQRSRGIALRVLSQLVASNARLETGAPARADQLPRALDTALRAIAHDALLLIITDGYGWDETSAALVSRATRHNDVIVVSVFDQAELKLPGGEELILSDGELQIAVDGRREKMLAAFQKEQESLRGVREDALHRLGVPVINIDACEPTLAQLVRALGGER